MFKTFVSLLSGHYSYKIHSGVFYYCCCIVNNKYCFHYLVKNKYMQYGVKEHMTTAVFPLPNIFVVWYLTLRLLMSYIYGAPSKAKNANVVYIWTYVWQR